MIDPNRYPPGWNLKRVRRLIHHYESQSDEEDNLFGTEFLGDQLGYGLKCGLVDCDIAHLRETSQREFCHDLD